MPEVSVNYLAVVVAAVASMIIGAIWYSPRVFGRMWMRLTGKTMDQMAGQSAGRGYLVTFIGSLVTAWVLAVFVDFTNATSIGEHGELSRRARGNGGNPGGLGLTAPCAQPRRVSPAATGTSRALP